MKSAVSSLFFPLRGQLRTWLGYLIWLPSFQAMHYEPIKWCLAINSWSLLEVSQWHHLNCHLISFLKENPSISFEHIEISDAGTILTHSWARWHFFSSRLSGVASVGRWTQLLKASLSFKAPVNILLTHLTSSLYGLFISYFYFGGRGRMLGIQIWRNRGLKPEFWGSNQGKLQTAEYSWGRRYVNEAGDDANMLGVLPRR